MAIDFSTNSNLSISGTSVFGVGSSGITNPYNPSFHANNAPSSSAVTDVVFGSTMFNIGNCYNTSNGRFTAPVAGVYYFRYSILFSSTIGEHRTAIYKNGSGYGGLRFINHKPTGFFNIRGKGHVYMSVNDYVTVRLELTKYQSYYSSGYNSFTGHFVG